VIWALPFRSVDICSPILCAVVAFDCELKALTRNFELSVDY